MSSGTGHFRKGQSISFADWDGDGDLDLFVGTGGARSRVIEHPTCCSGTRAMAATGWRSDLSGQGPTERRSGRDQGRHQLPADGKARSIFRTVGNNSGFGGNTLVNRSGSARRCTYQSSRSTGRRRVHADSAQCGLRPDDLHHYRRLRAMLNARRKTNRDSSISDPQFVRIATGYDRLVCSMMRPPRETSSGVCQFEWVWDRVCSGSGVRTRR